MIYQLLPTLGFIGLICLGGLVLFNAFVIGAFNLSYGIGAMINPLVLIYVPIAANAMWKPIRKYYSRYKNSLNRPIIYTVLILLFFSPLIILFFSFYIDRSLFPLFRFLAFSSTTAIISAFSIMACSLYFNFKENPQNKWLEILGGFFIQYIYTGLLYWGIYVAECFHYDNLKTINAMSGKLFLSSSICIFIIILLFKKNKRPYLVIGALTGLILSIIRYFTS